MNGRRQAATASSPCRLCTLDGAAVKAALEEHVYMQSLLLKFGSCHTELEEEGKYVLKLLNKVQSRTVIKRVCMSLRLF